ncbi:MAG: hypothetical protein QG671_4065 [Actinomycetota bacterium]|nr:hypothetical protein [Actinomycetota bacterium]
MNAARHLRIAPTEAEVLAEEISAICEQIDRRLGNPPGTAERGCYFHLWPLDVELACEVLSTLHADATAYLHTLTQSRGTTP